MRKGQLTRWNDEKGFGFIRCENSDEEIFLHISSLQSVGRRPVVDDVIVFKLLHDDSGRNKAINASIEGVESVFAERDFGKQVKKKPQLRLPKKSSYSAHHYKSKNSSNWLKGGSIVVVVLFLVVIGYAKFNSRYLFAQPSAELNELDEQVEVVHPINVSRFACQGKTRCSQMTSCDEAIFYLNNCPGSVTDGDGDGRPCEDQWCGH